jgi:hypothetical protein
MTYKKSRLGSQMTRSGAIQKMPQPPADRDKLIVGLLFVAIAVGGFLVWWSV